MSSNAIVLSIRPQYAEKIFKGSKTVELRRVRPKYIQKNSLVLMYISSPVQSIAGVFRVSQIKEMSPSDLWKHVKDIAGVTKHEFDNYYLNVNVGIGIFIDEVWPLAEPIKMEDWQEQGINFQPPQGFRYATSDELSSPKIAELVADYDVMIQETLWDRYENKGESG